MSKGEAVLLVPVGSALQLATGSWMPIFIVAIILNALGSVSCGTILPRLRRSHVQRAK